MFFNKSFSVTKFISRVNFPLFKQLFNSSLLTSIYTHSNMEGILRYWKVEKRCVLHNICRNLQFRNQFDQVHFCKFDINRTMTEIDHMDKICCFYCRADITYKGAWFAEFLISIHFQVRQVSRLLSFFMCRVS